MPHDTSKHQRLTDIDFSDPENHVALVGKAANGKKKFLITKSLAPTEEVVEVEKTDVLDAAKISELAQEIDELIADDLEANGGPKINMNMVDFLKMMFYVSTHDAEVIVDSIVKSNEDLQGLSDEAKKDFTEKMLSLVKDDSAPGAIDNNSDIQKEENSMPEEKKVDAPVEKDYVQKTEVEDLQKSIDEKDAKIAELEKAAEESGDLAKIVKELKDEKEARILKAFDEKADQYKALGSDEKTGKILKAVAGLEGGADVIKMLDEAVELISKSELLDEKGAAGEGSDNGVDTLEAIAKEMRESDSSLTESQAIVKAALENPELTVDNS